MKRLSFLGLAIVISFIMISATSAEMAKEGSGHYRSGRSAIIDILKMGEERLQMNFDETGVVVESPDNSPFFNASFRTMGTIHVYNGNLNYTGSAVWTRPNGDQIFGTITGKGKRGFGTNGILTIVGGTGECNGIQGTLKFKSAPVKSSKQGTAQGTTEGTISWEIP